MFDGVHRVCALAKLHEPKTFGQIHCAIHSHLGTHDLAEVRKNLL
jgi:hypothetical protein